jgi:hypothetical protein
MEIPKLKDMISKTLTQKIDLVVAGHRITNLEDRPIDSSQIEEMTRKSIVAMFYMVPLKTIVFFHFC